LHAGGPVFETKDIRTPVLTSTFDARYSTSVASLQVCIRLQGQLSCTLVVF